MTTRLAAFTINPDNMQWSTDEELVDDIQNSQKALGHIQDYINRLEYELIQRLQARQATEAQHPTLTVKLDYGTPKYDLPKLYTVAELVPPEEWAKAWSPETTKEVPVPASLDMRLARHWPKRYGQAVAEAFDAARLPTAPRLVIKRKPDTPNQAL